MHLATPKGRVLVIEDESVIQQLVRAVLTSEGHEVHAVPDGAAGLEALESYHPDVVVLDLLTPRMHGYQVIQRMRRAHRTRRTPIVVMSAQAYAADQRKALEVGADAFLSKPFMPEDLTALVSRLLSNVRVRFWGVRGSIATPGPETVRYGGNTPCVTVERGRDLLILDAGTGLRALGLNLQSEARGEALALQMLITHTHWDHIQGFPFFVPAFVAGNRVDVYGPPSIDKPLWRVLRGQMDPEYFPVALGEMAADVNVHEIHDRHLQVGAFSVTPQYVNHPGVTMAYRIEIGGTTVTYATDTEPYRTLMAGNEHADADAYGTERDGRLAEFASEADLYIADSQYTPKDYETKIGWGHTCYTDAIRVALEAKARRVALFSHDPMHDDDAIDRKLAHCRELVAEAGSDLEVIAATEGMTVDLPCEAVDC